MSKPEDGSHVIYYDSNDNPLYEAWAVRKGATINSSVWKIKKFIWTTGTGGEQVMTQEQWADSNELYDNNLNNRASLTYGGSS
jgi:hypothetical protein